MLDPATDPAPATTVVKTVKAIVQNVYGSAPEDVRRGKAHGR